MGRGRVRADTPGTPEAATSGAGSPLDLRGFHWGLCPPRPVAASPTSPLLPRHLHRPSREWRDWAVPLQYHHCPGLSCPAGSQDGPRWPGKLSSSPSGPSCVPQFPHAAWGNGTGLRQDPRAVHWRSRLGQAGKSVPYLPEVWSARRKGCRKGGKRPRAPRQRWACWPVRPVMQPLARPVPASRAAGTAV